MIISGVALIMDTGYGFGMQNKDMGCITDSGCELLSDCTDTDRLILVK